jgi:hypothetical protein
VQLSRVPLPVGSLRPFFFLWRQRILDGTQPADLFTDFH